MRRVLWAALVAALVSACDSEKPVQPDPAQPPKPKVLLL
jgi:hypothetical protein